MKRHISQIERLMRNEQPINWGRAFLTGVVGVTLMMAFIDSFYMMGFTVFSFENYLGSLVRNSEHGTHNWTAGVLVNWIVGGVFGMFYAYFFEYGFKRATPRDGILLGFGHAVLAAVAIFPFFNAIHDQMGLHLYLNAESSGFGFFGSGLGPQTVLFLLIGHLLFGATMGLLYGPVRIERVIGRYFEPGQSGLPGERGVITAEEDPVDRISA